MTYLILLGGCFGLDPVPARKDAVGHDLDSGIPLESGEPLESAADGNEAPVADAGQDDDGSVGVVVALDGSDSYDPDGDPLTYTWRFVSQPSASSAELVDGDRADPQFIPDAAGVYELGLVVSDGALDSDEDVVTVTATEDNGGPVANAGPDQTVQPGDSVTLDGSDSSDPDGDPLQFAWTLVTRPSGSAATLTSTTSATPRFVADEAGTYELSLTVSDGADTSTPDTVRVYAEDDSGDTGSGCGCRSATPDAGLVLGLALVAWLPRRRRA